MLRGGSISARHVDVTQTAIDERLPTLRERLI
jgi:hypothetical protein